MQGTLKQVSIEKLNYFALSDTKHEVICFRFVPAVSCFEEQIHRDLVPSFKCQGRPHKDYRTQPQAWNYTEVNVRRY